MADEPYTIVEIRQFRGMATVFEPGDLNPEFSHLQKNCQSQSIGELTERPGLREITFDD